ncbi:argininosuccinate lyase [Jeotgalicoccus sp. ATCC 8456]|uniref:argininosuccinate lyase n=1 Tax=Jeotgalicoccus sp. ATCC 8456 TaxID=946435 RepID=UPI0018E612E2|nr:argininosuccinate lyase [Jeotgalicoccus sp. ATCC 8456]QQD85480.1 argininosuccinate lyase [Jeotgalicoccus sp. ATCC 8456]
MTKKAWGGRFTNDSISWVDDFNASIHFDKVLIEEDIKGSIAHGDMQKTKGILTEDEFKKIEAGLKEILEEYQKGQITFSIEREDIHMNIEALLIEKIGPIGGKLHTARSRNDQVATDMHLYVKREVIDIISTIEYLQGTIVELAESNIEVLMPGYTHLQRAQPILFSHHILVYFWMLERDKARFKDALKRIDISPLGAGAISGTTFDIDRHQTQKALDFNDIYHNSMDAVSDRDYIVETLSNISLTMVHLSRLSEELIFWSTDEANFITLSDAFTTGSSMMPQKKNPDMAELIRGKSGRTSGHLMSMLMLLKGLPLTYNKDMQEDKEGLFDAVKTIKGALKIMDGMLSTMSVNKDVLEEAVSNDFSNATELADYLVEKEIPFRDAHEIVGKLVLTCINRGIYLKDLPFEEYKKASSVIENDIYDILSAKVSVNRRISYGSTGTEAVKVQLKLARERIT